MTTTNTIPAPRRVFLLGGTGTIGRATARALRAAGHEVVAMVRPRPDTAALLPGVELREGDPTEAASLARDGLRGERFDTLISCLASRSGAPADAWAIEHDAQLAALQTAESSGIGHMILLSAICVQKPLLEFQRAKLAFEAALQGSAIDWTIVRPTAFFKSLSGQVARVRDGKPYLLFGDGKLTACTPIHDDDLGAFLARCVTDPEARNRILPIGGPGPALTPLEMGQMLFELTGRPPRYRRVPVAMMDAIAGVLGVLGQFSPRMADKAEFARIGRYYATESMLLWNPETGRYDEAATPAFGSRRLRDHYAAMLRGEVTDDRGEHAIF
ncbi:MAG: NAD(P)H-binding protein [Paracoccaceae bacterium]